jgi:predicted dehydrogenase
MGLAQEIINKTMNSLQPPEVVFHSTLETLAKSIDLAIIATTADIRFSVIEKLCAVTSVKNLILEKVLFQKYSQYQEAEKLINKNSIHCWVNCPRRINPYYTEIKNFFADDPITYMNVFGGEWGLGCNGIHFLDLLAFLIGKHEVVINTNALDSEKKSSKRNGFIEFTGTLGGKINNTLFSISSTRNSIANPMITLRGEKKTVIIDEIGGYSWQINGAENTINKFSMQFQSKLTALVAEEILINKKCGLTSFSESVLLHLPFIKALSCHNAINETEIYCQIT